jgi:hypothetical protein
MGFQHPTKLRAHRSRLLLFLYNTQITVHTWMQYCTASNNPMRANAVQTQTTNVPSCNNNNTKNVTG